MRPDRPTKGTGINTPQGALLIELRGWLRSMGYKAPEVLEEERKAYIERITDLLGLGDEVIKRL